MKHYKERLNEGLISGLHKGWYGFVWMMKILAPISFLTALLQWSDWMHYIDFLLQPLMNLLSLPAIAALPLTIGMLTGIYGAIAAMAVLPLTVEQMTLIAIFLLMAHNLIQEGVIQGKSGLHPFRATLVRIAAAAITVMCVAPFLDMKTTHSISGGSFVVASQPFFEMLAAWCLVTLYLSLKIFAIIMTLMIVLETMKILGWIQKIVRFLSPVLRLFGLSPNVGILWGTAMVFGLAYGAAVIVEEAKKGHLTKQELEELHYSIGINHAVIEDPALFMSLGLSAFWLYVPRFVAAILVVRVFLFWQMLLKIELVRKRFGSLDR